MPFTIIKGTFQARNYSPDGDSIRFHADDPLLLSNLSGPPTKINKRGDAQLRIEGIDALETHYNPPVGGASLHQPLAIARAARDKLLEFTGIKNVTWNTSESVIVQADDNTRGHILTRSVDKFGRPIAFVYAGDASETDGMPVFLDAARLKQSYNLLALIEGLAYATYYQDMFASIRKTLTSAVHHARTSKLGIYKTDKTNDGFDATNISVITDDVLILPKLFRRLSEYMVGSGTAIGFKETLALSNEPVLDLREVNRTHFDTFVEQAPNSAHIKLTRLPEELVFDPMPLRPVNHFAMLVTTTAPELRLAAQLASTGIRRSGD